MKEYFTREKIAVVAATTVFSLGATACGGSSNEHSNDGPKQTYQQQVTAPHASADGSAPDSGLTITAHYYSDGTRELSVSVDSDEDHYPSIVQFCDGKDLAQVSSDDFSYGSFSREVADPVCKDGILTPSDFQLNPH